VARNELFKLAAVYGNQVKADPALSAAYRPFCGPRMSPYHAAVRDFMSPPKVHAIDLPSFRAEAGQFITIVASDDTGVVDVQVKIRHATSNGELEQGPARPSVTANQWLYTTTTTIPSGTPIVVEATAVDRPGHLGL
jgi:hypothetical protein